MINYCERCEKEVKTKIITREETYKVCGENISIEANVLVCSECGEEIFSEELDPQTLISAYNEYRRRHKLLFPEEIVKIREQYGLSQRSFAKLLNFGDKTIFRYENGAVQDKAHNSLLLFLRDPNNMRDYLMENEVNLNDRQKSKLIKTIDKLETDPKYHSDRRILEAFFTDVPSEENGFKSFDYEKTCAMVLFFANKSPELLKTKLMKLMNYSDMVFYKENGISISGMKYIHLPYGPVPENFDLLFGIMSVDHITHIEVNFENGYEKHRVIPECGIEKDVLSDEELDVLERVYERFEYLGSVEISNYSHEEKGYCSTKQGDVISYSYAKYIELN